MKSNKILNQGAVIRVSDLPAVLSVSRSTLYVHINSGLLPKPFLVGAGSAGFLRSEIDDLIVFIASSPSLDERRRFVKNLTSQRCEHDSV